MRELNQINVIRSVDRAIDLLDVFIENKPMMTIDEISKAAQLSKATVYRLLYTMERRGLIKYDSNSHQYSLGFKLLDYGSFLTSSLDIVQESEEILSDLHQRTGQTVLMALIEENELVYVFKREIQVGLKFSSSVGQRRPITFGALGRAVLPFLPPDQINGLLNRGIEAITPYTTTDPEEIIKQLEHIKKDGVFVETNETTLGVTGIGAPVFNKEGEVIAAIGTVSPSVQLDEEKLETTKNWLLKASKHISKRMGWKGGVEQSGE